MIDDSLWPLLIFRLVGVPTDEESEEAIRRREFYLARKQKHVVIYDTTRMGVWSAAQRQRQINWLKMRAPLLKELSLGSAIVIQSPAVRLVLSVALHFSQTKGTYHAVRSLEEGASWAAGRLTEAGLWTEAQRVRQHFGLTARRGVK